jgi:hypothetical protein
MIDAYELANVDAGQCCSCSFCMIVFVFYYSHLLGRLCYRLSSPVCIEI